MPIPPHAELVPLVAPLLLPGERILCLAKPNPARYALHAWWKALVLLGVVFAMAGLLRGVTRGGNNITVTAVLLMSGLTFGAFLLGAGVIVLVRYLAAVKRLYAITDVRVMELVIRGDSAIIAKTWGATAPLHFIETSTSGDYGKVLIARNSKAQWMTALGHTAFFDEGLVGVSDPEGIASLLRSQRYSPGQVGDWVDSPTPYSRSTVVAGGRVSPSASRQAVLSTRQVPDELSEFLMDGERVLWIGKPRPADYQATGGTLLYSICAIAIAIFVTFVILGLVSLLGSPGTDEAKEASALQPLLAIGMGVACLVSLIWYIVGRVKRRALFSTHTWYAVTNVRALILRPQHEAKLLADEPWVCIEFRSERIGPLKLIRKGTWGHLVLAKREWADDVSKDSIAFVAIENPEQVERLIKGLPWAAAISSRGTR